MNSILLNLVREGARDVDGTFDDVLRAYPDCTPEQRYLVAGAAAITLSSIVLRDLGEKISYLDLLKQGAERNNLGYEIKFDNERQDLIKPYIGVRLKRPKTRLPGPEGFLYELLKGEVGFNEKYSQ